MTSIQFLILLLIIAVFVMLIGHMMHYVYSENLTLFDCRAMYINFTIQDFCFKYTGAEIDPIR